VADFELDAADGTESKEAEDVVNQRGMQRK
jgi:hypothetical protein